MTNVLVLRIQEQREAIGITQTELGIRVGVSQGVVSEWESEHYLPKTRQLPALAKALGCTIGELFCPEALDVC